MRYKQLGRTSLEVSVLGFGASTLGNVFSVVDPAEGIRAVHQAIERGINFFDVSPYYGLTLAEQRLGEALAGKRDQVILATKCGRYGAAEFDFSAKTVTSGVDASLDRLQTDYLDLLQVHDVEFGDVTQIVDETLPALRALQQAGKARYIGITGYSLKTLAAIAQAAPVDTLLSYCRYNLMVQDMDDRLTPLAESQSIGLINASPLHMGILSPAEVPAWHPAPCEIRKAGAQVREVCAAYGRDLTEVALRFCLAHPYVSSTLVGMATVSQVEQNLRALAPEDDTQVLAAIAQALGPNRNYIWNSGRTENYD
jgi:L-galactose dehydrogenase